MSLDSVPSSAQAIVPLEIALVTLVLCLYVFLRRWLDDTTSRLFVIYLTLTALWNINLAVVAKDLPGPAPGLSWAQLASYGLIVLAIVYWTFARAFLQRAWITTWGWALGVTGLAVVVILDMGWLALPSAAAAQRNGWIDAQALASGLGTALWALLMVRAALTAEIQQFQTPSPAHKNRIYYLLISTVLLIAGYSMYLSYRESLGNLGLVITLVGNILLTYTLVSEDLLDIGTGARHAISALVIALVTVAVFVAGIYLVQILLGDFLNSTFLSRILGRTLLIAAVTAVLLTIIYTPIRQVSQGLINRMLLGRRYDYQAVIHNYSHAISNVLYLSELADIAQTHIDQALGVDRGALFILDSESQEQLKLRVIPALGADELPPSVTLSKETPITERLVKERRALAQYTIDLSPQFMSAPEDERQSLKALSFEWFVPIVKNKRLIGAFGLGPKRSGQPYSNQDLRLLDTLADQTALALQNAALFDQSQRNLAETTRVKRLMDNVFASMANAVITTDVNGKITLCNQAAEHILGVTPDCCLGHHYVDALPFLANTALPYLITTVISQEAPYANYEIVAELPSGGEANLSVNLTPLKDGEDQTKGVAIVLDDLTETKRLRAVQNMFRRYVSPAVVDRLPSNPDDLRLGGHRQKVTILFADLCDFTAFSERLAPEELVDVLNQYLSVAASSILMYEGTLDKFMGDALMGIFNAPLEQEDHVLRAVKAAAAVQQATMDYHRRVSEKHRLSFGVGVHVGEVIVGNVGMPDRMDYTAIGDAVNVAQRIQEKTPAGKVLISEAAYQQVKTLVNAVFYDTMYVKGREQPVRAYELKWRI